MKHSEISGEERFNYKARISTGRPIAQLMRLLVFVTLAIFACDNTPVAVEQTTFRCRNFNPEDEITLGISYPAGGETFQVGDTIRISLCYEDTIEAFGGEELLLETASGTRMEIAVFSLDTDEFIVRNIKNGKFVWTIPDSLRGFTIEGDKVPMSVVNDSCRIRFQGYGGVSDANFDYSGWFSIL